MSLLLKGTVSFGAPSTFSLSFGLDLPETGITAIFGPSGSGKSTLLRAVAGLERAKDALVSVNGNTWQDDATGVFVPVHERALGFVFQDARLFPHLNVRKNIEFGRKGAGEAALKTDVKQLTDLLGITALTDRNVTTLSGGERQRVAIARALACAPQILMLDEPLSALDEAIKADIMPYLVNLSKRLTVPALLVTHSLDEVATLADTVVLIDDGTVTASGPVSDILTSLKSPLSRHAHAQSVIGCTVDRTDEDLMIADLVFDGGTVQVPSASLSPGENVRIRIRAQDIALTLATPQNTSVLNSLECTVTDATDLGDGTALVELSCGSAKLLSKITRRSLINLAITPGMDIYAQIKATTVRF